MNDHYVNLLMEEYKLDLLFNEYNKYGLLINYSVNNLDIVLDMIGFPKVDQFLIEDIDYGRDWLHDTFYELKQEKIGAPRIIYSATEGVYFESKDESLIRRAFNEYIIWCNNELEEFKKERPELF